MSDFIAQIRAELSMNNARTEFNNFIKECESKKIKIELDSKGFDLSSLSKKVQSQANTIGKDIGNSILRSINLALNSKVTGNSFSGLVSSAKNAGTQIKEEVLSIKSVLESLNTGKFDAKSSSMKAQLELFNGQSSQNLTTARAALETYDAELTKIREHFNTNNSFKLNDEEFSASIGKMTSSAETFRNTMVMVRNETSKTAKAEDIAYTANNIQKYYTENTRLTNEYINTLKQLEIQARNAKTASDLSNVRKQFSAIKSEIQMKGLEGKSFFSEFSRAFKQIGQFTGIYAIIKNVAFQVPIQIFQAVKDVNAAQIELAKVTTASSSQLNSYWDEATKSAKKYGATISDVIKSTADWSRLGYDLKDAKYLSDMTTLLQKVGDNMTQESASQGLISTLKGFQMDPEEVGKIVDMVNEVANTQPIDTAGLFEGLENSASSMAAANNTLEQTIGLITAANSVVQDPSSVGIKMCRR